jgi:hypothetical protein
MTTYVREPGTYRTTSGELIHCRIDRDGTLVLEPERPDLIDDVTGKLAGVSIELVKLSDDPNWPDVTERFADPQLFAD